MYRSMISAIGEVNYMIEIQTAMCRMSDTSPFVEYMDGFVGYTHLGYKCNARKGFRGCYLAMNLVWLAEPSAWISVRITTVPGAGVRMVRPERSV